MKPKDITLFQIKAQQYHLSDIDNERLSKEILLNKDMRMSDDPHLSLFEDTKFDYSKGESLNLMKHIKEIGLKYRLRNVEVWSQIHRPYESTGLHDHVAPNLKISWVYYVQVPENSGSLCFKLNFNGNHLSHIIKPIPGQLILFPCWVQHEVSKNLSKDYRISVSGNYADNN